MSTPTEPRLETSIRSAFAPILRSEGFAGSGRRFHKCSGPWIQIVRVQGSRQGGSFTVNLGIHFSSAPDFSGNTPELKKMTEANCEFSRRLSESAADKWWKHEANQASMLIAIESAADTYSRVGRRYFELACTALSSITPQALVTGDYDLQGFGTTEVRLGLALARIRKLEGRAEASRAFAAYGLRHIGLATFLRSELEALAAA
jgi:hypothetical protein